MSGTIYVCHAVDTEGPLYESLSGTFDRLRERFGLELPPTQSTLEQLRARKLPLDGIEDAVSDFLDQDRIGRYLGSWDQITAAHETLMSPEWRRGLCDGAGEPYVFSWFCMDHVDFAVNPRRRAMGYHAVFEYYRELLASHEAPRDRIYWHYHPQSMSGDAHRMGYGFAQGLLHNEILARRIIDHAWFPVAQRPGGHKETYDINVWLEAWMPFDLGNLAKEHDEGLRLYHESGGVPGRPSDWRGAPTDWRVYHPDLHDFRKEGALRRWIAKSLTLNARHSFIDRAEIEKAFIEARAGKDVLVSYNNHDFRDMRGEVAWVVDTLRAVAAEHPDVEWRWANAVEAFRAVLGLSPKPPPRPRFDLSDGVLRINTDRPIWGVQPFLALKTKGGRYFHDNVILDGETRWTYVFDVDSVSIDAVSHIGIGYNDDIGNTVVAVRDLTCEEDFKVAVHNVDDWIGER